MTEQPTATPARRDIGMRLALIAAIASIGLTAAAFWLSYEHLHDVAHTNGLADAARSWAWPATVDLFIIIGELLMLRGSLAGRIDPWAITLTSIGSSASIALNVAGVGAHAHPMNYIVAAVPPIAALLAFGALMRQIHGVLAKRDEPDVEIPVTATPPRQNPAAVPPAAPGPDDKTAPAAPTTPTPRHAPPTTPVADNTPTTTANSARQETTEPTPSAASTIAKSAPQKTARTTKRRTSGRAPRRSMDEWVELTEAIFHSEFRRLRRQPTAAEFAIAIDAAGHGRVSDSTAKNIRTEILDRADVPALD